MDFQGMSNLLFCHVENRITIISLFKLFLVKVILAILSLIRYLMGPNVCLSGSSVSPFTDLQQHFILKLVYAAE